jgi:alkylation response protein AidB-like acyl-CoA dehydrogenase
MPPTWPGATSRCCRTARSKALAAYGEDWQKQVFLAPLVAGTLDRHHVPDRTALRHRPRPAQDPRGTASDGKYSITGTKIFITAGEHDLVPKTSCTWCWPSCRTRRPAAKGISLFVVPKFKVEPATARWANATRVRCGAIEHKMGIHGSATCVMNFDGAEGYLIGAAAQGPAGDVRDDESCAAVGRRAGPGPVGTRLPERVALCPRTPAVARCPARSFRKNRPTRSSSTPTCGACC